MSLITIIIPTYNRAHYISETLDSVLKQTYTQWECIIVDDGSTDDTANVVKTYTKQDDRFIYVKRPEDYPKGGNGARNYGFEIANGEFVNWYDDDDIMLPNFLNDKIKAITASQALVISYGYYADKDLNIKREMKTASNVVDLFTHYVLWQSEIITQSVLFRKDFLKDKALFNTKINRGQETEFFSRVFFGVAPTDYQVVSSYGFLYRLHEVSKTGKSLNYNPEIVKDTSFIYHENLKRGIILKNQVVIDYFYVRIIALWFRSLRHGDIKNLSLIASVFKDSLLVKAHYLNCKKVLIIFWFSKLIGKEFHFIKNYLKQLKFNY